MANDDVANDDSQVREILADKYKVNIERYKSNVEFVDEFVQGGH